MMPNVKLLVCGLLMTLAPLNLDANSLREELTWLINQARTPTVRGFREFAEQEFVIPKGRYKDSKFRPETQPFAALYLDELDTGRWRRSTVVGCVQSGKSIIGWVLPTLWHLFECVETVIAGAPTIIVDQDKWTNELLPAIQASRYAQLLPTEGAGSRGGWAEEINFLNGAALKFMAAKGGDERRSSYTSRVVLITEADKMDEAGEASRETDPVSQIEARTASYPVAERRFYEECTVSVPTGRIWTDYQAGTASRIACPCPHCDEYVTPEREHLLGWQDCESKEQAAARAHFCCPDCGAALSAVERVEMNRRAKVVHRGQTIDADGTIHGDLPQTDTLGFRWNAFNNLFWGAGEIGALEWAAVNAPNEDAQQRKLCQFYWATPYRSPDFDNTPLDAQEVRRRMSDQRYSRGMVPEDTKQLTMGVDVGKRFCSWMAIAWRPDCRGHVVDYGTFEVPSTSITTDRAVLIALLGFRDELLESGFSLPNGGIRLPDRVLVDSHYESDAVYSFIRDAKTGRRFLPAIGYGESQHLKLYRNYRRPTKKGPEVKLLGEEYHVVWSQQQRVFRLDNNADHWKTWLHKRLRTPEAAPGSLVFFHSSDKNEHTTVAKHFAAEYPQETFVEGKGSTIRWYQAKRGNHFLDCAYMACVAAHLCGLRLLPAKPVPPPLPVAADSPLTMPDGRAYLITERD